jgi:hypothetical protein
MWSEVQRADRQGNIKGIVNFDELVHSLVRLTVRNLNVLRENVAGKLPGRCKKLREHKLL